MKLPPKITKLHAAGALVLALALLVFVQAAFSLDPLVDPSEANQIVLLYTLSTFIFLVLLIFGFVLLRTLVKVWFERKQQKPGSKFKTSILVALVSLTLIPARTGQSKSRQMVQRPRRSDFQRHRSDERRVAARS